MNGRRTPSAWLALVVALFAAHIAVAQSEHPFAFRHPGLLHTSADLARVRQKVAAGEEPWARGFERLKTDRHSAAEYSIRGPREEVGRNPGNAADFDNDATAAYQCALMWAITGNKRFADKSREIVAGWSGRLERVTGADAVLMAGLGPFKMINAAEILRYTDPEWTDEHSAQAERMFRQAIYPVLKDFAPFANGNWDTAAIKTVLAIGIFTNDRSMFERALRYYIDGAGDGRLTNYVINEAGQCQESGRDTQHAQLGLAHLGDACEMAWNQGLDLYSSADDRLLKGFEYTARFQLGDDVPFVATLDRTGKYRHMSIAVDRLRGRLRPIYEQIYNHFVNRADVAAPWTAQAAEKNRPKGASQGGDHPGFGTLLYSRPRAANAATNRDAMTLPSAPAAVIATGAIDWSATNRLTWIASRGAASYTVRRANSPTGPVAVLAADVPSTTFVDTNVERGALYSYTVSAVNDTGEGPTSLPVSICTGLPNPWTDGDVGSVETKGLSSFDGNTFVAEGAGRDIGGAADQFHWVSLPLAGDGEIVARFVPQFNSQSTKLGLMIRAGRNADAPHITLLIDKQRGGNAERPSWHFELITRTVAGQNSFTVAAAPNLPAPYVTYGRLVEPYWLKLSRQDEEYIGAVSPDGEHWTVVGRVTAPLSGELRRLRGLLCAPLCDHARHVRPRPRSRLVAAGKNHSTARMITRGPVCPRGMAASYYQAIFAARFGTVTLGI